MNLLLLFLVFVLGLCFGSFVNMLVYRIAVSYKLEDKKFKVKGQKRSFCDYCGKQLRWYENVPLFSWLVLRGKTRCCHKKLPVSYPVVEVLMGILFIILNFKYNLFFDFLTSFELVSLIKLILGILIVVLLVFSAVFDWKYMILPDFAIIILIIVAFIGVVFDESNILPYLLSALISSIFLLILNLITKGKGMGMGDVKLAVFMGLFLGYPKIILAFYIAFIVGAIYGLILIIFRKANKKSQVPFGPFLILGTLIALFLGEKIIGLVGF
jgi:prepilin signal peptidase PulO-like enzyme (type II secretory pathway)